MIKYWILASECKGNGTTILGDVQIEFASLLMQITN